MFHGISRVVVEIIVLYGHGTLRLIPGSTNGSTNRIRLRTIGHVIVRTYVQVCGRCDLTLQYVRNTHVLWFIFKPTIGTTCSQAYILVATDLAVEAVM